MKMAIVMRTDLAMGPGKEIAQGAHAAVGSYLRASRVLTDIWGDQGQKKIVFEVNSAELLLGISCRAAEASLSWYMVRDAGKTEVEPGTMTEHGVGPGKDEDVESLQQLLHLR